MILRKTGFTIVGILTVFAIIGILAAVIPLTVEQVNVLPEVEQLADEALKGAEAYYGVMGTLDGFNCERHIITAKYNCSAEMRYTQKDFKADNFTQTLWVNVNYKKRQYLTTKRYSKKVVKTGGHISFDD